jgi:SAM-dependent methyltransferase
MLHADLVERRGDPQILLHLAEAHFRLGNPFHAECYAAECEQRSGTNGLLLYRAIDLLVRCYRQSDQPHRAAEACQRALERFRGDAHFQQVLAQVEVELRAWPNTPDNGAADGRFAPLNATGQAAPPWRLYLGCGRKRLPGYVHSDIAAGDGIDVTCDLSQLPWPWNDNSVETIVAEDLIEHLPINLMQFAEEAWRVLAPGGELMIRTPHHQSASSWIDPTHRWHLNEQAFHYLDPDTEWGRLYPQYTSRKWRLVSLGIRGPQNIHALLMPRK